MPRRPTLIWCPQCDAVRPCRSVNQSSFDGSLIASPGLESKPGRWYLTKYPDIRFYRRWRECTVCLELFDTAELPMRMVDELADARARLRLLKAASADVSAVRTELE